MEFLQVVGNRRSIRWFRPWQRVPPEKVQRILEAARVTGCPGNLQPWRAVVVTQDDLDAGDRDRLLDAANHQRPHEQAPVWIYWFGDPSAVTADTFLEQISIGLDIGMLAPQAGWDAEAARAAIEDGVAPPVGMPPLHQTVHGLPGEVAAIVAAQETVGAITTATLAAVNEGLGTCLHTACSPQTATDLYEVLGVPTHFVPSWLQLVGYPAENPEAGGARPREPFEALFASMRWGNPLERDSSVVAGLAQEGLIQAPAPLPGRDEEVAALARMFGYGP